MRCRGCGKELGEIKDPGTIDKGVFIAFKIKYVLCKDCYKREKVK